MRRAAAGSPGRRVQRRRLPGRRRRRRRRVPRRRKAGACGRKRARPRQEESRLESPGQAELATWESGCSADCPDPVRAGPPPPPPGRLARSQALSRPQCLLSVVRSCAKGVRP